MYKNIVSTLVILCFLAASNFAISAQNNWNPVGLQQDWCDGANWSLGVPPTGADWACIQPGDVNAEPIINAGCDALADALDIAPWGFGGTGILTVNGGTATFGSRLGIGNGGDFPDWAATAYLYVYSGTVTTNTSGSQGLIIGKPYSVNRGSVIMYGGLISVPRISFEHGSIELYGGTLECTGDANFIMFQNRPENKIYVNGGKLKLSGNYLTTDPCLPSLIANGRLLSSRGTLGTPVYNTTGPDANYTTITSTNNDFNTAWDPSPVNNATNVHYRDINDVNVGVTLAWSPGDGNVQAHDVYFGTSSTALVYQGTKWDANGDSRTWDVNNFAFKINTAYYWRVDEEVNNVNEAGVSTWTTYTGKVWKLTTHDGKAYNPKPSYNAQAITEPFALSWTKGDFSASTLGHKVYFSSIYGQLNPLYPRPTDSRYRGQQTGTSYSLSNLAGAFTLVPGNTYYWAVDEVNSTTTWKGPEWKFTVATYINIDDFEDYNSIEDLNANWLTNYNTCPIEGMGELTDIGADRAFIYDASGKYMRFTYTNLVNRYFSENKINYGTGTSFTGSPVLSPALAAVAVTFRGVPTNPAHPDYDRMYIALEDTADNVGVVYNPDPNAQREGSWTQWFVSLDEFTSQGVNLGAVKNCFLGMGQRCNWYMSGGGDGNVMFDNIRLYAQTCNPEYAHENGVPADLDNDCDVDINDLDVLVNSWLARADLRVFSPITEPNAPILWYKFDETGLIDTAQDSGTGDANNYLGTISNFSGETWKSEGRTGGGCLYLPTGGGSYVTCPPESLSFMADSNHDAAHAYGGVTFSVWMNADVDAAEFKGWVYGFIVVKDANGADATTIACPHHYNASGADWEKYPWAGWGKNEPNNGFSLGPGTASANYGTRWNHWAFVKSPTALQWYCNGNLIKQELSTDANNGDANIPGPLFPLPVSEFSIARYGWGGAWVGKIADFQVYDYGLSAEEVQYLATDGTGSLLLALTIRENLMVEGTPETEIVNLKDLVFMGQEWHQSVFWP